MARGINKVILLGNCGRDPEVRYLPDGKPVASITLATSSWSGKENQEKTDWHRVTFFGRTAEVVSQYVRKGTQIYVEGRISYGQYEKDGITRYTTDIIANEVQLIGNRNSEATAATSDEAATNDFTANAHPAGSPAAPKMNPNFDDDIPF